MVQRLFKDAAKWRAWLRAHHATEKSIDLVLYKKKHAQGRLTLEQATDEALCWGWIDSVLHRIDDQRHSLRFSPRQPRSTWSASNKQRVARLIATKKMAKPGLAAIERAKHNGSWDRLSEFEASEPPEDLVDQLSVNRSAQRTWDSLPPSHQKQYLWWIHEAKQAATRQRRIAKTIDMCLAAADKLRAKRARPTR